MGLYVEGGFINEKNFDCATEGAYFWGRGLFSESLKYFAIRRLSR